MAVATASASATSSADASSRSPREESHKNDEVVGLSKWDVVRYEEGFQSLLCCLLSVEAGDTTGNAGVEREELCRPEVCFSEQHPAGDVRQRLCPNAGKRRVPRATANTRPNQPQ